MCLPGSLPDKPVFNADPLNLFVVVEVGDHHATILDGDKFEPIHRFQTRFALHGGPKFTPDGRFVYFASRDGWISKFDIYNLKTVAEVRAGINTRNLAVSGDGKTVLVGNYLPHSLVLLDAEDLTLIKVIPTAGSGWQKLADFRGVPGRAARQLCRGAEGCQGGVGDFLWRQGFSDPPHSAWMTISMTSFSTSPTVI